MSTKNDNLNPPPSAFAFLDSFQNAKDKLKILERAVESAGNGIVITDPQLAENPIVYANQAFLDITGYELQEILGRNCRFLQGLDHAQPEIDGIRAAITNGIAHSAVLRNYKKDGSLFWNELHIAPVNDEKGKIVKFIGVQNDVTMRIEAERRVAEFYSLVSHELRTPLSSITVSLELIQNGSCGVTSSDADKLISIAINNTNRLLRLVDNVLDLKKMESGHLQLKSSPIIPDEIISEVLDSLLQFADSADIRLEKGNCTKKAINADADLIKQVLINLIANAIKFSPPASTVNICAEELQTQVKFSIQDEGLGIDPEDIKKLFNKFTQLDSSDTRLKTGSGLGLIISKNIIELHGGSIGVDSTIGEGSCFWFILPKKQNVSHSMR